MFYCTIGGIYDLLQIYSATFIPNIIKIWSTSDWVIARIKRANFFEIQCVYVL